VPQGGSVLLVRLSALGDVLFALETVTALHQARPDLALDFLVDDRFGAILGDHPHLREVLCYPRKRRRAVPRFLAGLRRRRWDLVLDLHGLAKSALCVGAARAPRKLGFAPPGSREGAHRAYTRAVELPVPLPHRAARGFYLLADLGLIEPLPAASVAADPSSPTARPALGLPGDAPQPWSATENATRRAPRVVLHPGTSAFAAFKRWPAERFAQLGAALLADGAEVVVSFGPGERDLAQQVASGAPGLGLLDGKDYGLLGLGTVYRDADLVVAADTGPLHLAAAVGTRVVALFGPKDPSLYGPRGEGHAVLFRDVPCRPCRRRRCPAPLCIRGLDVEPVLAAARASLASSRASATAPHGTPPP